MKWPTTTLAIFISMLYSVALGKNKETCVTYYTSPKPKSVIIVTDYYPVFTATGTTTTTSTIIDTTTHYPGTVSRTVTTTSTFTYYTTAAPTTETIPTPAGFIPAASAKNRTSTTNSSQRLRRRPAQLRRSRARGTNLAGQVAAKPGQVTAKPVMTESYLYDIICEAPGSTESYELTIYDFGDITSTVSDTTDRTIYSTSIIHTKTTSTVHQSTATVYAACFSQNTIDRFEHHPINNIFPFSANIYPGGGYYDNAEGRAALQSPRDCCQSVFANNLGFAWFFSGTPGLNAVCSCLHIDSAGTSYDWGFNTAKSEPVDPPFYVGNGPGGGTPYFAGFGPHYHHSP